MRLYNQLFVLFLFMMTCQFGISQVGSNNYYTTKSLSMGTVGSNFTNVEGLFANPAGAATSEDLEVLLYVDNRFNLSDLTSANLGVLKKINPVSSVGLSVSSFGLEEYKEQVVGISYARKLIKELSIGLKFNYLQTKIENFGSSSNFTYELGLFSRLSNKLTLGGHILSANQENVTENTKIPSRVTAGLAYHVEENLHLYVDFVKFLDEAFDLRFGIEYHMHERFKLRAGGSTNPAVFSAGFAYQFRNFSIELGNQYHSTLQGLTPGIGVIYRPVAP